VKVLSEKRHAAKKWLPQLAVFMLVIGGIHFYRTQHMLSADMEPAPPLALASLEGTTGRLAEGDQRPALVYFFAPWCHYCAASAHNIRNLQRIRGKDDLAIYLVALDWQNVEEVRNYVSSHALNVRVLLGTRETARQWGVSVFPTYYLLDSEHRVAHRDYGYSTLIGLWLRSILVD